MFLSNKQDQYPHLAIYLRQAKERRRFSLSSPPVAAFVFLGLAFVIGVIAMARGAMSGLLGVLAPLALVGGWLYARKHEVKTHADLLHERADEVAKKMSDCLERRRLHRDLDEASLALIEECARQWHRTQLALGSPHWDRDDLPPHLQNVRDQCVRAADQGMDEVMLLFGPLLPAEVESRGFLDYAEEIAEGVFTSRKAVRPLPAAFEPARQVAEKLKLLASEVEKRTQTVSDSPNLRENLAAGRSVDLAIGELRQLDEAESELRQNLGG